MIPVVISGDENEFHPNSPNVCIVASLDLGQSFRDQLMQNLCQNKDQDSSSTAGTIAFIQCDSDNEVQAEFTSATTLVVLADSVQIAANAYRLARSQAAQDILFAAYGSVCLTALHTAVHEQHNKWTDALTAELQLLRRHELSDTAALKERINLVQNWLHTAEPTCEYKRVNVTNPTTAAKVIMEWLISIFNQSSFVALVDRHSQGNPNPALHWPDNPAPGEIELGVQVNLPCCALSEDTFASLMADMSRLSTGTKIRQANHRYQWINGLFLDYEPVGGWSLRHRVRRSPPQVKVNVRRCRFVGAQQCLSIGTRADTDELDIDSAPGKLNTVREMWQFIAPFLLRLWRLLDSTANLPYKIHIEPVADLFYEAGTLDENHSGYCGHESDRNFRYSYDLTELLASFTSQNAKCAFQVPNIKGGDGFLTSKTLRLGSLFPDSAGMKSIEDFQRWLQILSESNTDTMLTNLNGDNQTNEGSGQHEKLVPTTSNSVHFVEPMNEQKRNISTLSIPLPDGQPGPEGGDGDQKRRGSYGGMRRVSFGTVLVEGKHKTELDDPTTAVSLFAGALVAQCWRDVFGEADSP